MNGCKIEIKKKPFFLWVHYYDAHSPYHPKKEFDHYGPEGYEGKVNGDSNQVSRFVSNKGKGLTKKDLARLRALYLAEMEYMDSHLGRLLQAFDSTPSNEQNIMVAISDHGENLGEGGRFFHGADLYETSMHIPMMIRWPNRLLGDQQAPDKNVRTVKWESGLLEGKEYKTGRYTFATRPGPGMLLPSGLIGPVQIMVQEK